MKAHQFKIGDKIKLKDKFSEWKKSNEYYRLPYLTVSELIDSDTHDPKFKTKEHVMDKGSSYSSEYFELYSYSKDNTKLFNHIDHLIEEYERRKI